MFVKTVISLECTAQSIGILYSFEMISAVIIPDGICAKIMSNFSSLKYFLYALKTPPLSNGNKKFLIKILIPESSYKPFL